MRYTCYCGACRTAIVIDAAEIPRLVKLNAHGYGPQFMCPLGHSQAFRADVAAEAAAWLRRVQPELAAAAWDVRPAAPPPPPPWNPPPPTPEELAAREAERVARLNAKIADIDDYLARRGKYAPTPTEEKPCS